MGKTREQKNMNAKKRARESSQKGRSNYSRKINVPEKTLRCHTIRAEELT